MHTSPGWSRGLAAGLSGLPVALALATALSLSLAAPAKADTIAPDAPGASENIRRLDVMLMVTGLRCRATADDFQADFQLFEARHLAELNAAARDMVQQYATQMTLDEANLLVDRLTVRMANRYGNGHPWLGCHDLKGLTQSLAVKDGRDVLVQAASETLDGEETRPGSAPVVIAAR